VISLVKSARERLAAIRRNRKLQVVGNGGWDGTISYAALAEGLRAGYATASTDTGHSTPGGEFVVGHPEKLIDFSWLRA
jgi:feruloyl esterase